MINISEELVTAVRENLKLVVGEEFEVLNENGVDCVANPYKFTENDLINCDGVGIKGNSFNKQILGELLFDKKIIKKIRFNPKNGEQYWTLYTSFTKKIAIGNAIWNYSDLDFSRYHHGLVFKTKEEAEANREKFINFTSFDWRLNEQDNID